VKQPTPRLEAVTKDGLDRQIEWAEAYVDAATAPSLGGGPSRWALTPWKERAIADVAALKLTEMRAAEKRASKLSERPTALAVVVLPARIEDPREWEARARELEAKSRSAIDTTAVPVPAKGT